MALLEGMLNKLSSWRIAQVYKGVNQILGTPKTFVKKHQIEKQNG